MIDHSDLPLIPRKLLFSNPDRASVTISPDGSQLMWLAPLDGVLNIWIAPRETPAAARAITKDCGQGIRSCFWTYNKDIVLSLQDKNGDENWHLYAIEPASGKSVDLTPFEGVRAEFYTRRPSYPNDVIVGLNHRNPKWHDIYRINIVTGECNLILEHNRFLGIVTDNNLEIRLAAEMAEDGGLIYHRLVDGKWQPWQIIPAEDMLTTNIAGFDKTNETLYMRDSRERNTSALVAINLATGKKTALATDDKADIAGVALHPSERNIQAVTFFHERMCRQILDKSVEADFALLHDPDKGDLGLTSRSHDDNFWIVCYTLDNAPLSYYLYERQKACTKYLFTHRKALENHKLAKMNPVWIKARDSLDLLGYYSLPPGTDNQKTGIPDQPLPLVFTPHGGPWGRDYWSFHGWHQWLANRGYAVLSVNFRASTGFGKAFVNAGNLEWGDKIILDQQDAVQWAVDTGIADPSRLAVFGGSFGGYSALAGLTFTPELFACGVDLVGIANLVTWMQTLPAYWEPMRGLFSERVGDLDSVEGRTLLEKHSPINYVDRICKPLLVGQGANDPRVKQAESDQIVRAMQAKGIPVTYALYPDEGHGFVRPQNNLSFYSLVEAFLAKHIGGRCEPIGNDFEGSSAMILAGVEQIPGLRDVLVNRKKE
ncbi:MAG: S9 family peptidase [Gammaproteobacteria bacterium]|nr:S9 family peptidase [Gammaproteobacteria bacterium]